MLPSWRTLCRADRAFLAATVAVLVGGVTLRFWGWAIAQPPFWGDEAAWASRILRHGDYFSHRPPGYVLLVRLLAWAFGNSEPVLRAPSFFFSVLGMFSVVWVTHRVTRSGVATLFAAWLISFSPLLISYAQEFKPYSLELALHAVFVAVTLHVWERRGSAERGAIAGLLLLVPLALPFAFNLVFIAFLIYPLLFLIAHRQQDRRLKVATIASALTAAVILGACLYRTFGNNHDFSRGYWGAKYNVFYLASSGETAVSWYFHRFHDLLSWPSSFSLRLDIPAVTEQLPFLSGAFLFLAGIFLLVTQRRYGLLVLFLAPLTAMGIANIVGKWPLGAFRANLFIFSYVVPVMALPLSLNGSRAARGWSLGCAMVFAAISVGRIGTGKVQEGDPLAMAIANEALIKIQRQVSPNERVVLYTTWEIVRLLEYYGQIKPTRVAPQVQRARVHVLKSDCIPAHHDNENRTVVVLVKGNEFPFRASNIKWIPLPFWKGGYSAWYRRPYHVGMASCTEVPLSNLSRPVGPGTGGNLGETAAF